MNNIYSKNNRSGFTLMELLIVVAIISILGLFSFPIYTHFYQDTYSGSDLIKIENLLKRTRQKSLSSVNDSSFGVFLNKDGAKFIFYQGESFETRDTNMDQEFIFKPILLAPAVNVDINFLSGEGLPSNEQTFIFENNNGDTVSLIINKFGGIFLE